MSAISQTNTVDMVIYRILHDFRGSVRAIDELPKWIEEDLKLEGQPLPNSVESAFALLSQNAKRLNTMLDQMAEYTKSGAPETRTLVDLGDCLNAALQGIELPDVTRLRVCFRPPRITAAPADLTAALRCLILNAVRHNETPVRIAIICRQVGSEWHLSVRDNGVGIAEQKLQDVFQPMVRDSSADDLGSGMGLAIVGRIADAYGGRAWAEKPKRPHHGATIHVVLPNVCG